MLRVASLLCLIATPVFSETRLEEMQSSDIVAELNFLATILPPPVKLRGSDRQAFENYFSSLAICLERSFERYLERVGEVEMLFVEEARFRLGKRSYEARLELGCNADPVGADIVETYLGDLNLRFAILESVASRREEMFRRTLYQP